MSLDGVRRCSQGQAAVVDDLPNPATAERNQQRKLAFIPMWPLVGAVIVVVALIVWLH